MNFITIDNYLYKLKAKDFKRLELSTQGEKKTYRGNKMLRFTTEDTNALITEFVNNYKPIGEIKGIFNT